jgi:uncharacterized membrane protein required for colicin V production
MDATAAFNAADLIAVIFVLVGVAVGFKRGLIGQMAPVVGLIVLAAAVRFGYAPCREWLTAHLNHDPAVLRFGALAIVIGVPLVVMLLLRKILGELVKLPIISGIDRLGGAIAGFIAATLFVLVIFLVLGLLPPRYQSRVMTEGSWIGRHVASLETNVIGVVSQKVDHTEGAILKAREKRAGRREKWEQ